MIPNKRILNEHQFSGGTLTIGSGVVFLEGEGLINMMIFICQGEFNIERTAPHLKIIRSGSKLMIYSPTHTKRRMNTIFTYSGEVAITRAKIYNYYNVLSEVKIKNHKGSIKASEELWNQIQDEWQDLTGDKGLTHLKGGRSKEMIGGELSPVERGIIKIKKPITLQTKKIKPPAKITSSILNAKRQRKGGATQGGRQQTIVSGGGGASDY